MQGVVLTEEFARAKAPLRADFFGDTLVGPTILQWGTEEQKKEFLPADPERHDALVPGLQRAEHRLRPRLAQDHGRARRRRVGHQRPEGVDHRRPPRRLLLPAHPHRPGRRPSTRASATCSCRCTSPASRCAASSSPTAPPSSARCSSPTPAARRTTSSAASTTAGRSPTPRSRFERGMSATTGYRRFEEEYKLHGRGGHRERHHRRSRHPPAADGVLHEDPDPADQRPALAVAPRSPARRTSASSRSARRTRCSGPRCTRTRWNSRSTSTAPTRC